MKYQFEECIGSRVRSMSRKIDSIYRKHLNNSGVTENQLSILMALYKTGKIEQKNIGLILNLEKSSLSRNLIRLISSNFIKKNGPANRPSIKLTSKGKTKVDELTPYWESAMEEIHLFISDNDLNTLKIVEEKINNL
tara:strand:+ start:136363 stop:136773 length:411 start_codon:yes stop_codon:yes gene_type:complete